MSELVNVAEYEARAAELLEPGAHGYFAGGAGDERTLRDNADAYRRWRLRPRVLVDVGSVDPATTVLGREISMPVIVGPVALQRLAHPDGEEGMARAAATSGTVMCLSTLATATPSECAAAAPAGTRWLQLYVMRDRGVTQAVLDEAVAAGFEAVALTVDAPVAGRRERDFRTGFAVPAELRVPFVDAAAGGRALTVQEAFALVDPTFTWDGLADLIDDCPLPVLVKGLITAEDARLAALAGAAGVVVSNHGGRQLDGVAATIDALPEVVDEVGDELEVLVDGGVRRGTDVVTALALGARAVLVGRPTLWGLAVDGEAGARRVLDILREETARALALCGCPTPADVTRAHVERSDR